MADFRPNTTGFISNIGVQLNYVETDEPTE